MSQRKACQGSSISTLATSDAQGTREHTSAPAMPRAISTVTKGPARADVAGDARLSLPNTAMLSPEVAHRAVRPCASAAATGGWHHRRSQKAQRPAHRLMPNAARYDSCADRLAEPCGSIAMDKIHAQDNTASACWGLSAAENSADRQNISTARTTDGEAPHIHAYATSTTQEAVVAMRLPKAAPSTQRSIHAITTTCWPDSARIWAQPASRNMAASSWSRSSLQPSSKAFSKPDALPPARSMAASIAPRTVARIRSKRGAALVITGLSPANHSAGLPSACCKSFSCRLWPRTTGKLVRAQTVTRPLALARRPSGPHSSDTSSTMDNMPLALSTGMAATLPMSAV